MAFQTNVQAPDMVSLALNLMQMKRQADLEERRMALEEAKMQAEQRAAELQARRDNIEWGLNIQKSAAELDAKRQEMGGGLAPSLGVVMDPAATGEEQRAAGSNYANSLMQRAQILAGFDENGYPNPVRGEDLNALGNIASGTLGVENAKARNTPTLDWEYRENGDKRRVIVGPGGKMTPVPGAVWVPPKSGVTVNVGGEGLDLNQIATASREERKAFQEKIAPFEALDNAKATLESFRAMADKDGNLPYEAAQFVSSDVMAAMRAEALNEGDVKRLTAVGLWNAAKGVFNIPPQMTVRQTDTLVKILDARSRAREPKRRAIIKEGAYRAKSFGFDPRLIIGEYADESKPKPKDSSASVKSQGTPGILPPMTGSDKVRIEGKLRKILGIPRGAEVPAVMILDAWKTENGQGSPQGTLEGK